MTDSQDKKFEVVSNDAIVNLRSVMTNAGCVFDFCTYKLIPYGYAEELHKEALAIFFKEIDEQSDLKSATGIALSKRQIESNFSTVNWRNGEAPLFAAFIDPPYSTKWRIDENEGLMYFKKLLFYLGWENSEDLQILDWVGNPDINPGKSGWSNYFDDGKEWWGILCLTIWNPKRRTIGVLAASATD
jgi:hypothetical protein